MIIIQEKLTVFIKDERDPVLIKVHDYEWKKLNIIHSRIVVKLIIGSFRINSSVFYYPAG